MKITINLTRLRIDHEISKEHYYESDEEERYKDDVEHILLEELIDVDLTPIKYCQKLRRLDLIGKFEFLDLTSLGSCKALEELVIQSSKLNSIDLSPLSTCSSLESVEIELSTDIPRYDHHPPKKPQSIDLSPLSTCKELKELKFAGNPETIDLSPLVHCTELQRIELNFYQLHSIDLEPLSNCNSLISMKLSLGASEFLQATGIPNPPNLESLALRISEKFGTNLSPLRLCTKLQKLKLGGSFKSINLSPLRLCAQLEEFDLQSSELKRINLKPLRSCKNLKTLTLFNARLEKIDLSPISKCQDLRKISLRYCNLQSIDLTPLETLQNLEEFSLDGNDIEIIDLYPLATCSNLQIISLKRNKIQKIDTSCFNSHPKLDIIGIDERNIETTPAVYDITHQILSSDPELRKRLYFDKWRVVKTWLDTELFKILEPGFYYYSEKRLEEFKIQSNIIESWSSIYDFVQLMKGTPEYIQLTNGILKRLGLKHLGIIDRDLTDVFLSTSRDMSFDNIRRLVEPHVVEAISQQIDRMGTTIGIDIVEITKYGELAKRIPDINNLRKKEVEWIISQKQVPKSLSEISLSAYGFDIVTAHDPFQRDSERKESFVDRMFGNSIMETFLKIVDELGIVRSSKLKGKPYVTSMSEECKKYILDQAFSSE